MAIDFIDINIQLIRMQASNIESQLKFVNRIGQTLSTQERIRLKTSMMKLGFETNSSQINFWGRIEGAIRNYYVVEIVNYKTVFPEKKYYWSSEDFVLAELPAPRLDFISTVKQLNEYFTGQHEKIIIKGKGKSFTQLDRLSILVHLVDYDCQVVPLGAFKMLPTHQLIRNPDFRGLKVNEAMNLEKYVHLRAPSLPQKKMLIECDKALERDDFLDCLNQDPIKQSWSVQSDESKTEITLRSLLWPGYLGYHRTNSSIYGGVYMGTGIRAQDLQFIL